VFPTRFCSRAHFWFPKLTTYPHVHIEPQDDSNSKLKVYISELILDTHEYMTEAHVITRFMIFPRSLIVAFFWGTGEGKGKSDPVTGLVWPIG
jgi:hypothetical protein